MTHLGLGSSLEEPWLDLWGGCEGGGGLPLEVAQASRGRLSGLKPGGKPSTLPVCPGGVWNCALLGMPCGGCWRLGKNYFLPLAVLDLGCGG